MPIWERIIKAIKELGQHFLNDEAIAKDIALLGKIQKGERIWEIGPGPGILSNAIIEQGGNLQAFELDKRMAKLLYKRFGEKLKLKLIDILKLNWQKEIEAGKSPLKIIANIPYQITSPLLYKIERHSEHFSLVVLMVQKELAERLCAEPGTKSFGQLSLKLGLKFKSRIAFYVGKEKFDPMPMVESAVIVMEPRKDKPQLKHPEVFYQLVNAAFLHKRKNLRNNLLPHLGKERFERLAELSGIDFKRRAETLDEQEFIALSELIATL